MERQIRFNRNGTTLDLTASPYSVEAGRWSSSGEVLSFAVIATATTLAELDRYVNAVRRWLAQAAAWEQSMAGDVVYVETKLCDEVTTQSEIGAGWVRKAIKSGGVDHEDVSVRASGQYTVSMDVSLMVSSAWERSAVEPILVASSTSTTIGTDGSVTVPASATLTARRVNEIGNGFTVRVRWAYSDNDCTFFLAEAGTYDIKAYYQASDNKLYMQDSAGTTAASGALTTTAGTELDLVFKWDPSTPKMGIWVNGSANGTAATCVLDFGSYGSELVVNGGFETVTGTADDGTSDAFSSWINDGVNDGAGDKIEKTATVYAGSSAVKATRTAGYPNFFQVFAVNSGRIYKLAFYTRGDGTKDITYIIGVQGPTGWVYPATAESGVTGTSYTLVTRIWSFTEAANNALISFVVTSTGGTAYVDAVSIKQIVAPDTYQIFAPSSASQTLYSWQMWPAVLTDAECAAFSGWGRPEPELAYLLAPSDADNTDAFYKLYNVPGTETAPLRAVLGNYTSGTDYDQVAYGLRPLRIQTTHLWECESGTLGAQTANNANADASGGNQARFTPASTSYGTQVTVALCADPDDVAAMQGRYRLYLACYDSAATVAVNQFQWRMVVAGVAGDWSSTLQATAVSSRVLVDVGEVDIPPGAWPEESVNAVTDVIGGSFITIEFQIKNTTGGGGGTFDFDALYAVPSEVEGVVTCADLDNTDEYLVVDFASDPVAAVTVRDYRTMEFASWAMVEGDDLALVPVSGSAGGLWLYAYRNTTDQAYPNDDLNAWLYYRPRWR